MQPPRIAERVRVHGSEVQYFVVTVDEDRQVADLIPISGTVRCLDAVPFGSIDRTLPQTGDLSRRHTPQKP